MLIMHTKIYEQAYLLKGALSVNLFCCQNKWNCREMYFVKVELFIGDIHNNVKIPAHLDVHNLDISKQ